MTRRLHKAARRFTAMPLLRNDRKAAIAMIFAALAIPLMAFLGLSIDYGMKTHAETTVVTSSDSAALVAATTAASAYSAGQKDWQTQGQTAGTKFFNAEMASVSFFKKTAFSVSVQQDSASQTTFIATVNYAGTVPTNFGQVVGVSQFSISGQSSAITALPSYVDFHFVMDNSSSMLIGSTQDDMNKISAKTGGCVFGCHSSTTPKMVQNPNGGGKIQVTDDFYGQARAAGATMRLDVVAQSISGLIDTIANKQKTGKALYQVALYTFDDANKSNANGSTISPTTLYKLGADFTKAKQLAVNLGSPYTPVHDGARDSNTDITGTLQYVSGLIPSTKETGTSTDHKQYLFLITDGVGNKAINNNWPGPVWPTAGAALTPIDPTACTALKNKGVQIYVLYTAYIPIPSDGNYNYAVKPWNENSPSTLRTRLQSCASSSNAYFEATSASDIQNQMQNMLQAALGSAGRLTR